jgi:hypothetical protein
MQSSFYDDFGATLNETFYREHKFADILEMRK